jgi:hypothetical protein
MKFLQHSAGRTLDDTASGSSDRFGYSWQHFSELTEDQREQFRRWTALLGTSEWRGRSFLDAGCGACPRSCRSSSSVAAWIVDLAP